MATKINYYTAEGLEKLTAELHDLKTRGRKEASNAIAEARAQGDLSENAEYDAAKDAQGMLEMKISKLEAALGTARVLDESLIDLSKVMILCKVKVKNLKVNKEFTYKIVSQEEANLKEMKISASSPIGKGLLGKTVGDIAKIQVPAGKIELEIIEIGM